MPLTWVSSLLGPGLSAEVTIDSSRVQLDCSHYGNKSDTAPLHHQLPSEISGTIKLLPNNHAFWIENMKVSFFVSVNLY